VFVCYCGFYISTAYLPLRPPTRCVTNNSAAGTLNRCTRNPVGCKSKREGEDREKKRGELQRRWKKTLERAYYIAYIYTRIYLDGAEGLVWWWERVGFRSGIRVYMYGHKTKGYVLLHTYSIWKMAAQGITRRFFFISLPRAKTVGFHFRAFSTLRRARFI